MQLIKDEWKQRLAIIKQAEIVADGFG